MYKRLLLGVTAGVLLASPFVYADSQNIVLTDYEVGLISANCQTAQSNLNRVHANDALARVHLGQEYETISTKFMAAMNSRVALAKLDGVALAKTTVDFNNKLQEFRRDYQQYEQSMSKLLQMKCSDQPLNFYNLLLQTQNGRAVVRQNVLDLGDLVVQYKSQVQIVKQQALGQNSEGQ